MPLSPGAKEAAFWIACGALKGDASQHWTIEVIWERSDATPGPPLTWTVLFSESGSDVSPKSGPADDFAPLEDHVLLRELQTLRCIMAYSNSAKTCDFLAGRGFAILEAEIVLEERDADPVLVVKAPAFPRVRDQREAASEMNYRAEVLRIEGFRPEGGGENPAAMTQVYEQDLKTPDLVLPADFLRKKRIRWPFLRNQVVERSLPRKIFVPQQRWPQAGPFAGTLDVQHVWTGALDAPWRIGPREEGSRKDLHLIQHAPSIRTNRTSEFGAPDFRFEDVEVIGFRIDVPIDRTNDNKSINKDSDKYQKLCQLIEPLNFHLPKADGLSGDSKFPDFSFRPATTTLIIELLRYGRMTLRVPFGGVTTSDYQSQHELLVRLVVGRVDEDCAQAQQAATFVPAIFVDNPWSKFVGRVFLGMEKRMAHFCVRDEDRPLRLLPNGRIAGKGDAAAPLSQVAEVHLADKPDDVLGKATRLFSIESDLDLLPDWDDFEVVSADAALRDSPLLAHRWRQDDFGDGEVRDFARAAGSAGSFRTIQTVPVGERRILEDWEEEITWIPGRFDLRGDSMLARPGGALTVALSCPEGAPEGWARLCRLLDVPEGHEGKTITLTGGDWYRLREAMDLTLENGLG